MLDRVSNLYEIVKFWMMPFSFAPTNYSSSNIFYEFCADEDRDEVVRRKTSITVRRRKQLSRVVDRARGGAIGGEKKKCNQAGKQRRHEDEKECS